VVVNSSINVEGTSNKTLNHLVRRSARSRPFDAYFLDCECLKNSRPHIIFLSSRKSIEYNSSSVSCQALMPLYRGVVRRRQVFLPRCRGIALFFSLSRLSFEPPKSSYLDVLLSGIFAGLNRHVGMLASRNYDFDPTRIEGVTAILLGCFTNVPWGQFFHVFEFPYNSAVSCHACPLLLQTQKRSGVFPVLFDRFCGKHRSLGCIFLILSAPYSSNLRHFLLVNS